MEKKYSKKNEYFGGGKTKNWEIEKGE